MAMVAALTELEPTAFRPLLRREYDALVEMGLLVDEPVELIRGRLVYVVPQGAEHAYAIEQLQRLLVLLAPTGVRVRSQLPLAISDDSEPEPDFALLPDGGDRTQHPTTALLVIEVAASSIRRDRAIKAPLYAEVGIPEFWLIDVERGVVEVYTEPRCDGYAEVREVGRGDRIVSTAVPEIALEVADFLPR